MLFERPGQSIAMNPLPNLFLTQVRISIETKGSHSPPCTTESDNPVVMESFGSRFSLLVSLYLQAKKM